MIVNLDNQGHLAGHRVSGAGQTGVIGPKGHLHQVQQSLADFFPFLYDSLSGLLKGHADGRVVVGGAHDEIGLLDDAIFVGDVMVN